MIREYNYVLTQVFENIVLIIYNYKSYARYVFLRHDVFISAYCRSSFTFIISGNRFPTCNASYIGDIEKFQTNIGISLEQI